VLHNHSGYINSYSSPVIIAGNKLLDLFFLVRRRFAQKIMRGDG